MSYWPGGERKNSDTTVGRYWTWFPKRMTSGKIVWYGYYYRKESVTNVEPRHMWIRETLYSEQEYFLIRMSEG